MSETWGLAAGVLLAAVLGIWAVARFHLSGADLSAFDRPATAPFSRGPQPGPEIGAVLQSMAAVPPMLQAAPMRQRKFVLRKYVDEAFADRVLDATFVPVDAGGVPAEWVLAPGADPARRLLYIHGGAFIFGSPRSHRTLTSRFSALAGASVLAIDYRLMPEHPRRAGIEDCRRAWQWLVGHGPGGAAPAEVLFVAGDSAGGNLTLSLLNWLRDAGHRAPDAAVALSPLTDSTMASPSMRANVHSDAMLGPLFGALARVPHSLLLWMGWLQNRINPRDPVVSPLRADLSGLPPVLVQASAVEMLRDDAQRYVNKARAAGSPAELQLWDHMVHVWQIFNPELPEAEQALERIGRFLEAAAPRRRAASPLQEAA